MYQIVDHLEANETLYNGALLAYMNGQLRGLVNVCHVDHVFDHNVKLNNVTLPDDIRSGDAILLIGQICPKENGVYCFDAHSSCLIRQKVTNNWHGGVVDVGKSRDRFVCLSPCNRDREELDDLLFYPF